MKKIPWLLMFVIVIFILIPLAVRYELKATRNTMLETPFLCKNEADIVINRWGELGYMRYCISKNGSINGVVEAWEYKRLKFKGNYIEGKRAGKWVWYDENGSVSHTIEYKN